MKHSIQIETNRLVLKGIDPDFIHSLFLYHSKEFIIKYLGLDEFSYLHYLEMHQKGMVTHRYSLYVFMLVRKSDNLALGECGFHTWNSKHHRAELFYLLRHDDFKRQGYMKEALPHVIEYGFNIMNLHRIQACVAKDNQASIALLNSHKFQFEGTLRQDYTVDDINEDSDCYSLLKPEWVSK